jgi:small subunit ribosomal protein S11
MNRKHITYGIVCIQASFTNTIVSITDTAGNVISWSSGGACGFRGARKSTPFAAQIASETAAQKAIQATGGSSKGLKQVEVRISGPGAGRETALRGLQTSGLVLNLICDRTPVPHNGCRAPKKRRV